MVKISSEHIKEKSTWYKIDGELYYFKERDEIRMFTEMFCSTFAKILGLKTADYIPSCLKELVGVKKGPAKLGLISKNFQNPKMNYYLFSDLLDNRISNLGTYGEYSLENLLQYFLNEFKGVAGVQETIQALVNMFIFDFFTNQTDRNVKNVCCEVDATPKYDRNGYHGLYGRKISSIHLAPIFDSEKSLGIMKSSHGFSLADKSQTWNTACPYSVFENGDGYEEIDPNILLLFMDNEKIARPLIERLANGDEYKLAMEQYQHPNSEIHLDTATSEHLSTLFEEKQKQLKKLLAL
jgi:hypothetical protein